MNQKIFFALGAIGLLGIGIIFGSTIPKKPEPKEVVTTAIPTNPPSTLTVAPTTTTGSISGYLIYPSSGIPESVGVCAQNIDDPKLINCVKQIKDKKFKYGVGFQMDLQPGNYYVYSYYKDTKAYYDEFVICGLKAECKSHTKIPVVVTAGSSQENILPHDWYEETLVVTSTTAPTPTLTIAPTNSPTPTVKPTIVPVVTIKFVPGIIKLIPTNTPTSTPTPVKIVIPTINIPHFGW